jgi:hypothetical protein
MALTALTEAGQGVVLGIGTRDAASAWRIVQTEIIASGDVLVTLKALTAFGIIPDLLDDKVPFDSRGPVKQALERAVNSAFRETAVSVVDQCRNAISVVLAHYLVSGGEAPNVLSKDLQALSNVLNNRKETVLSNVSHVVARLHSRGKGNEQQQRGTRVVAEQDGEFAVQALGLVLREVGWTLT